MPSILPMSRHSESFFVPSADAARSPCAACHHLLPATPKLSHSKQRFRLQTGRRNRWWPWRFVWECRDGKVASAELKLENIGSDIKNIKEVIWAMEKPALTLSLLTLALNWHMTRSDSLNGF